MDGGANADGSAVLNAKIFDPTTAGAVNTSNNTLNIGDTGSLATGDMVTYSHGDGTDIGGLTDGESYYVNLQKDGTIRLYDTQAHATAGGATAADGLVILTGPGTGTHHALKGAARPAPRSASRSQSTSRSSRIWQRSERR